MQAAGRIARKLRDEQAGSVIARYRWGSWLCGLIPKGAVPRLRAEILRRTGWPFALGCVVLETPTLVGTGRVLDRLVIGRGVFVNVGAIWDLGGSIEIGDNVAIGHRVMLLTSTHEIGAPEHRAGSLEFRPIRIGRGAWIGAGVIVLPGVTIGEGAVVGAGTVVRRDVPPHSLVRPADPTGRVFEL